MPDALPTDPHIRVPRVLIAVFSSRLEVCTSPVPEEAIVFNGLTHELEELEDADCAFMRTRDGLGDSREYWGVIEDGRFKEIP